MREEYSEYREQDYYATRPNNLKLVSDLSGWEIARGQDIRGWSLVDKNRDTIGKIRDVLVDTTTGEAIFALIEQGGVLGLGAKKTLIPLDELYMDETAKEAVFSMPTDRITDAPDYDPHATHFGHYYDYWSGKHAMAEEPERMAGRAGGAAGVEERVIPEVEEHLEVGKRAEQVGEVEIHKEVETRPETVSETVQKQRVRVFRRPVEPGREVKPGEQVLREGETISVPIVEERLVTEKKAEVTGEVVVQPETVEKKEEVTREVRKEHVEVEEHGDVDVEGEAGTSGR
ncbi:MAG: PRC and DUF2382 domain-containing protein [Armatimonadota bacterium]